MQKMLLGSLVLANAVALILLLFVSGGSSTAAGGTLQLSDLTYGSIDCDGDGKCTPGDDWFVQEALEKYPHHIDEALKAAKRNKNGTIDLSPYLQAFSSATFTVEREESK